VRTGVQEITCASGLVHMGHMRVMFWAMLLVAFLGCASHRTGLCTVRAVADVLENGRFERFGGFARAVLRAMLPTLPAICFFPEHFPVSTGAEPPRGDAKTRMRLGDAPVRRNPLGFRRYADPRDNNILVPTSIPSLTPGSLRIDCMPVAGVAFGLWLERYASARLASRCRAAGDRDRCDQGVASASSAARMAAGSTRRR
jgi:hypothetical protein